MEKHPKHHEIIAPIRELGQMVLELVVPAKAVEFPRPGEVGGVPAHPTMTRVEDGTVA